MNIKEQLERWIERASNDSVEKWFKDNGWVATESKVIPSVAAYKAGANDIAELLLIAVSVDFDNLHYDNPNVREDAYNKGVSDCMRRYNKALAKIQEKIKG